MSLQKGMTKAEIERELYGKGDFVQIDNLTRFLKEILPLDTKKFVYAKLIEVYEKRNMFAEAGKLYEHLAEFSTTFNEKIKNFIKASECYIKSGFFDRADCSMKKALSESNSSEKANIYITIKDFYKKQAEVYIKEKRRNNALKIYEKMINMNISEQEKKEIQGKLLDLYESLGMVRDFMEMKKKLEK